MATKLFWIRIISLGKNLFSICLDRQGTVIAFRIKGDDINFCQNISASKTVSFVPQDLESHDTYKPTLSMNINDRYIDPAILTYTSINSISYNITNARDK